MQDRDNAFFIVEDLCYDMDEMTFRQLYGTVGLERIKNGKPFDALKTYIKSCPAFLDDSAKIEFTEDKIIFKISLQEAVASFPELICFFGTYDKRFSEENINTYQHPNWTYFKINFCRPLKPSQKDLIQQAKEYFEAFDKKETGKILPRTEQQNSPDEVLINLLKENDCLAIGEVHEHLAGKKLLIDNMQALKDAGVTHIFMEHLLSDTQSDLLEKYFVSETMPVILQDYLRWLDKGFQIKNVHYSFTRLVMEAKKHGIKIIPVDTVASYSTDSNVHLARTDAIRDRNLMMNYCGARQIETCKNSDSSINKYIHYGGSGHVTLREGVPGMSEIMGCPALVVEDLLGREEAVYVNPDHIAKPDVLIRMNTAEKVLSVHYSERNFIWNEQGRAETATKNTDKLEIKQTTNCNF